VAAVSAGREEKKDAWMHEVDALLNRAPEQGLRAHNETAPPASARRDVLKHVFEGREDFDHEFNPPKSEMPEREKRIRINNPFPQAFPGAVWHSVTGEGILSHLSGEWPRGRELIKLIAVAGAYAPHPPRHLFGFTRYIRTRQDGYWIKIL